MQDFIFENPKKKEVAYFSKKTVKINKLITKNLKFFSNYNKFNKSRFCCHDSKNSNVHEMIIFHKKGYYIRAHSHPGRSESIHVIKGKVDIILFNEIGDILDVIEMGDFLSDRIFYYRLNSEIIHTLIIRSKELIFHETTSGPFTKKNIKYARWSPKKLNKKFQNKLLRSISAYKKLYKI
jgi:cupin fold WbuC family metalloprotein